MSNPILRGVLFFAAFVVGFIVVREFKIQWFESREWQGAGERAADKIEQEIKSAQTDANLDKSATEILMDKARSDIAEVMSSAKSTKEKLVATSNIFFGAYFMNTRARPQHCATLGVEIKSFTISYEDVHRELFLSAEAVQVIDFKDHGKHYDIDKFYQLLAPVMKKITSQDMRDTAAALNMTEESLCHSFEQNSADWAKAMDIRKSAPEIAQLLLRP
jgi:hypothetical protein